MKGQIMIIPCETCKNEFDKPDWQVKKSKHNFCSRKCANVRINIIRWKDHTPLRDLHKCSNCGQPRDYRCKTELCLPCFIKFTTDKNKQLTVGYLKSKHVGRINPRWYSAEIRNYAKTWNPDLLNKPCQKCSYTNHTELCHIKAIKDFNDDSTLGEINHPNNLLVLCPNHHWEFDNNLLSLSSLTRPSPE